MRAAIYSKSDLRIAFFGVECSLKSAADVSILGANGQRVICENIFRRAEKKASLGAPPLGEEQNMPVRYSYYLGAVGIELCCPRGYITAALLGAYQQDGIGAISRHVGIAYVQKCRQKKREKKENQKKVVCVDFSALSIIHTLPLPR